MDKRECPFCGCMLTKNVGRMHEGTRFDWCQVICDDCGARGPEAKTPKDAHDLWNDREPESQDPRDMGWVGQDGLP